MANLAGTDLLVATGNSGKLEEFRALLGPFGVTLTSMAELGLNEPEETEFGFAGNALLKARAGAAASGMVTLADDSGLVVFGLGGAPGIYSADWAECGSGRDFGAAMAKTWGLLEAVTGSSIKLAEFRCVLALVWPDGQEKVFDGRLGGQIVWPKRGKLGHGYDPFFQPTGFDRTLGEVAAAEKNRISHRADAIRALISECFT